MIKTSDYDSFLESENEKLVSMGKVLKAVDVEKLLRKVGV